MSRKTRRVKKPVGDLEVTIRDVEIEHREPEIQTREPKSKGKPKMPVVPMLRNCCPHCGSIRSRWQGSDIHDWGRLIRKKCVQCGKPFAIADKNRRNSA